MWHYAQFLSRTKPIFNLKYARLAPSRCNEKCYTCKTVCTKMLPLRGNPQRQAATHDTVSVIGCIGTSHVISMMQFGIIGR